MFSASASASGLVAPSNAPPLPPWVLGKSSLPSDDQSHRPTKPRIKISIKNSTTVPSTDISAPKLAPVDLGKHLDQAKALHKNSLNLQNDYSILYARFYKEKSGLFRSHGIEYRALYDLDIKIERLKDHLTGALADTTFDRSGDYAHHLAKQISHLGDTFNHFIKTMSKLRIELEGNIITQYTTRSKYILIGNQPNYPYQFTQDETTGEWIQNGTIAIQPLSNKWKSTIYLEEGATELPKNAPAFARDAVTNAKNKTPRGKKSVIFASSPFAEPSTKGKCTTSHRAPKIPSSTTPHARPSVVSHGNSAPVIHASTTICDSSDLAVIEDLRGKIGDLQAENTRLLARLIIVAIKAKDSVLGESEVDHLKRENTRLVAQVSQLTKEMAMLKQKGTPNPVKESAGTVLGKRNRA